MKEAIRNTAISALGTIVIGAVLWWSVVEVRLANAETNIGANKETIAEVKEDAKESMREIKSQVAVIDEKITAVLLLLSKRGEQ